MSVKFATILIYFLSHIHVYAFANLLINSDKVVVDVSILYFLHIHCIPSPGAATTTESVGKRLTQIIDVGISKVVLQATQDAFILGVVISENANPFKWLFGGPEIEDIAAAVDDFMEDVRDLETFAYLRDHLNEYLAFSYEIADKFAENAGQIAAMQELVDKFNEVTDTEELLALSENYIQAYGAYSPQV